MLPRKAANFAAGQTLSPTKLNQGFEQMQKDAYASTEKRYCYSSFQLDFTGMTAASVAADASVASYLIKAPFAWEIVSIELISYVPIVAGATSLSLTNTLTGSKALVCTPGASTDRGYASQNVTSKSAAATEQTFTLAVTGTGWTLGKTYAIVHIRADRRQAGSTFNTQTLESATRIAAGASVVAATINTAFTDYQTLVAANTAANKQMRIQVFSMRPVAVSIGSADDNWRIPATLLTFDSGDVVSHGASGEDVNFKIVDPSAGAIFSVTVLGNASVPQKTQSTSIATTQTDNSPTNPAKDFTVDISRIAGVAAIPFAYCVIYYT